MMPHYECGQKLLIEESVRSVQWKTRSRTPQLSARSRSITPHFSVQQRSERSRKKFEESAHRQNGDNGGVHAKDIISFLILLNNRDYKQTQNGGKIVCYIFLRKEGENKNALKTMGRPSSCDPLGYFWDELCHETSWRYNLKCLDYVKLVKNIKSVKFAAWGAKIKRHFFTDAPDWLAESPTANQERREKSSA